jgi:CheY-like chemotaxis protein
MERGAEFGVRLPLDEQPALHSPPRPTPAPMARRRVLVVEDNADAAETLCEMLRIWQHEVELARDGRTGLERIRTFRPDVVLCDVGLPELDGYGVARAVRADPSLAGTFLVAVTGYASPDDQRRAADAGFDRHLAKPVPVDVIEEVLATSPRLPRPPVR